jgi:hypothetical protein
MNILYSTPQAISVSTTYASDYFQDTSVVVSGITNVDLYLIGCVGRLTLSCTKTAGYFKVHIFKFDGDFLFDVPDFSVGCVPQLYVYSSSGVLSCYSTAGNGLLDTAKIYGCPALFLNNSVDLVHDDIVACAGFGFASAGFQSGSSFDMENAHQLSLVPTLIAQTLNQYQRDAMKLAPSAGEPSTGSVDSLLNSLYESAGTILTDTSAIKDDVDDIPGINNYVLDIQARLTTSIVRSGTAQGGATGYIQLDSAASEETDFYKELVVVLTGGTGVGQVRQITGYNGGTKRASVGAKEFLIPPDATTTFEIVAAYIPTDMALDSTVAKDATVSKPGIAQTITPPATMALEATSQAIRQDLVDGKLVEEE